ncbi:uncharacterized protein VTP21DRAFT_9234 [Calcarisporiella thermophila]|uniref:uncharacterized protein n=1 Tax=Calcarisporiella thermophila TaxID=911321 RepID=UPI003742B4B1
METRGKSLENQKAAAATTNTTATTTDWILASRPKRTIIRPRTYSDEEDDHVSNVSQNSRSRKRKRPTRRRSSPTRRLKKRNGEEEEEDASLRTGRSERRHSSSVRRRASGEEWAEETESEEIDGETKEELENEGEEEEEVDIGVEDSQANQATRLSPRTKSPSALNLRAEDSEEDYHEEMMTGDLNVEEEISATKEVRDGEARRQSKMSVQPTSSSSTVSASVTCSSTTTSAPIATTSSAPNNASTSAPNITSPFFSSTGGMASPLITAANADSTSDLYRWRKQSLPFGLPEHLWMSPQAPAVYDTGFVPEPSDDFPPLPEPNDPEKMSAAELDRYFSSTGDIELPPDSASSSRKRRPSTIYSSLSKMSPLLRPRGFDKKLVSPKHPPRELMSAARTEEEGELWRRRRSIQLQQQQTDQFQRRVNSQKLSEKPVERFYSSVRVLELGAVDGTGPVMRYLGTVASGTKRRLSLVTGLEGVQIGMVNATQLCKRAGADLKLKEDEPGAVVVREGPSECRGVWVPVERAKALAKELEMEGSSGICQLLAELSHVNGNGVMHEKEIPPISQESGGSLANSGSIPDGHTNKIKDSDIATAIERTAFATAFCGDEVVMSPASEIAEDPFVKFEDEEDEEQGDKESLTERAKAILANLIPTTAETTAAVTTTTTTATTTTATTANYSEPLLPSDSSVTPKNASPLVSTTTAATETKPEVSTPPASAPLSSAPSSTATSPSSSKVLVPTITPVVPAMHITVMDKIAVFETMLTRSAGFKADYRLLRRVDTNMVNATLLLQAGGVETEAERSIVLSLELRRSRVRKADSPLNGVWIPLERARALAATCSLHHRLGPFLNDDLLDEYFPRPLPISLPPLRRRANSLIARAISALRRPTSSLGFARGNPSLALAQLLLGSGGAQRHLKSGKAPMLGAGDRGDHGPNEEDEDEDEDAEERDESESEKDEKRVEEERQPGVIAVVRQGSKPLKEEPVNPDTDEDTDTDEDVEQMRERMKRMRAAALEAMEASFRENGAAARSLGLGEDEEDEDEDEEDEEEVETAGPRNKKRAPMVGTWPVTRFENMVQGGGGERRLVRSSSGGGALGGKLRIRSKPPTNRRLASFPTLNATNTSTSSPSRKTPRRRKQKSESVREILQQKAGEAVRSRLTHSAAIDEKDITEEESDIDIGGSDGMDDLHS